MPKVTANGKTFNFPDGTTPEQMGQAIDEYFQVQQSQSAASAPVAQSMPEGGSIANSLVNGATFGFGDEILAGVMAGVGKLLPEEYGGLPAGHSFGDAYRGIRENINADKNSFAERNPVTAIAGEVAGGLATGGYGLAKIAPKIAPAGSSLVQRAIGYGGTGAAEGAIAGAGNAEEGERMAGAGQGALIGGALGFAGGEVVNKFQKSSALKRELETLFNSGSTDTVTARYMRNGAGKIVTDRNAKESIKQGFDEGVIAAVKGSSDTDKSKMLQMINVLERRRNNAVYSVTNRPSDIVGDSIASRIKAVNSAKISAGQQLDSVAESLKGQIVDVAQPVNTFLDDLRSLGVSFKNGKAVYADSDLEGIGGAQNMLDLVIKRMRDTRTPDAYDAHRLKRFIDEQVIYGKSATGLGGKAESIVKKLRRNLDGVLDTNFPEYNRVNTQYSEARQALDGFQDAAGSKIDLLGDNSDKALGVLSRRLMSNIQSRVKLMDSLGEIESTARKYGGNFDDDIMTQVLFVDELESMFGASAKTSLSGEVAKGVKNAARVANQGMVMNVVEGAGHLLEKARGINEKNAIKAIRKVLATQSNRSSRAVTSSSVTGLPVSTSNTRVTP